jgi:Ca-activated chloride channel family protein
MDLSALQGLAGLHFTRPAWLLALPPLLALAVWLARRPAREGRWALLIDAELRPALCLADAPAAPSMSPWPWLALAWTLAVLALAGPAWQHEPAAAWRAADAWVLVLDLSPSMNAADQPPSRVTRARYAIRDLLAAARDARVGLVVFSDEPYTVTPLTDDVATVRALLQPLAPDIMPSPGDHLAPALAQAGQLLDRAAVRGGHVVVLSDGFDDPAAALAAAGRLRERGATVDVVGLGTAAGAPVPLADGGFAHDSHGAPELARQDSALLQALARAGGGQRFDLAALPSLIDDLQAHSHASTTTATLLRPVRWRDAGAWLLPVLLLSAALLARRGWL